MEFFFKYKIVILRSIGAFLLILGFVVHFWAMPKTVAVSANDIAAANVARMEASISGHKKSTKTTKPNMSHFSKSLASKQQKQLEYLTIFAMIFGVLFLAYSFLKKEND